MVEMPSQSEILKCFLVSSVLLLIGISVFLLFCPSAEMSLTFVRAIAVPAGIVALVSLGLVIKCSFLHSGEDIVPRGGRVGTTTREMLLPKSTSCAPSSPHPHIISKDLLKTAAAQKKTIEDLRAMVQELEKQLTGANLQIGFQDLDRSFILWSKVAFRRILDGEVWRSRRAQRPLSLLLVDLNDEMPLAQKGQFTRSERLGSTLWQDHAEVLCRSVRGGDHVGLGPDGIVCVVLPETASDGAETAEKRLRRNIGREHQRRKAKGGVDLAVTIAKVSFPSDGKTVEELFAAGQRSLTG